MLEGGAGAGVATSGSIGVVRVTVRCDVYGYIRHEYKIFIFRLRIADADCGLRIADYCGLRIAIPDYASMGAGCLN